MDTNDFVSELFPVKFASINLLYLPSHLLVQVSVNMKVTILQSNRAPVFSPTTQQLSFTEYDVSCVFACYLLAGMLHYCSNCNPPVPYIGSGTRGRAVQIHIH